MPEPRKFPQKSELDSNRISWLLLKLSTPAFLGMFVQGLNNVINTIFVGQYVSRDAIGGLGIVFPLQMFAMGIGMMVGIGGLSVMSRAMGSGDNARAEHALGNCFFLGLVLSVIVMVILMPFSRTWLNLLGAEGDILDYGNSYLLVIVSGTIFNTFAVALLSLVRAEGNTRIPMISMIIGALVCVAFTALFVITFKWGVAGSAWATVISQIASMIFLFTYYTRGQGYLKMRFKNFKPDFKILRAMLAVGISSFVQTISSSVSGVIMLHNVSVYGGALALDAFGIVQRVMMFVAMPAMAIGQGLQPILGFNYGAGRYRLGLRGIYMAYGSSTILCLVIYALVMLLPGQIVSIFRDDPELINMGIFTMRRVLLAVPLMGVVMVGQMIFQAIGKAGQSFVAAFSRPVLFMIPLVLVLSHFWKLEGTLYSFPASDTLTCVFIALLMIPVIMEFRKLSRQEGEKYLVAAPAASIEKSGGEASE
ncbi:MAG TPA: MATE family efflux transporter [Dehalococcoidales bacterium]|nr:MATE family efflux transporter [Dehalococcoidales bacterium]